MLPKWLGEFYGHDLSLYEMEILAIQHIGKAAMQDEAVLLNTKWFDYARLHPVKATYYFVKCYDEAYGEFNYKALDMNKRFMKSFKGKDFMKHKDMLVYWKLRQLCDRFGVRYDFFLRESMNWWINRKMKYAPRPAQILRNEEMITDVMLLWEEELANSLQTPKDAFFRVQNYQGHPAQQRFEDFVIGQIKTRRIREYSLSASLYINDSIRVERAIEEFGSQAILQAIRVSCIPDKSDLPVYLIK